METFLEANLCKPFQIFRHILNDVKSATLSVLISVEGAGENQLEPGVWEML
jgi:hypothetical protein